MITLLHQILVFDPLQRPDASDLLNHPWVVGSSDPAVPSQPDWEGHLPPSVFTTDKPNPADANQKDPIVTLVATPQGPPDRELEPPPLPLESSTPTETDTTPTPPVTLSDSTTTDTPNDKPLSGPTAVIQDKTFYLEDGNVEVLCEDTLFRVHASAMSFHSHALRQMFTRTNLATAESPNGCPRLLSLDTPEDFATLLKIVYLPWFVAPSTSH